jgi:hypothetical protein
MPFMCSICAEESTRICARCTKDACDNHLCEKCLRCSDCCECEVTLADTLHPTTVQASRTEQHLPMPDPEPEPEEMPHPHPSPDPDPFPEDDPALPATP